MKATLAPPGRLARRHRRLLIGLAVLGALLYASAWRARAWQIDRRDERLDGLLNAVGARGTIRQLRRSESVFYPPSRNYQLSFPGGASAEVLGPLASLPPEVTLNLDLADSGLTDEALSALRPLAGIDQLILGNGIIARPGGVPNRITGAGLARLKGLDLAQHLDLSRLGLSDADLARLPPMPRLYYVNLAGNAIRGPGLRALKGMPNLMSVDLSDNPIGDDSLSALPAANLYQVNLDRTAVTPRGLASLSDHPRLSRVTVEQGQFDQAQLDAVAAAAHRFTLGQNPRVAKPAPLSGPP